MAQMVEVRFEPAAKTVWVAPGSTILAAGSAAELEILTGCTRGMCGTDAVRIEEGAEGLSSPSPDERGTLERMGLLGEYRLACSARLESGPVRVRLDTF